MGQLEFHQSIRELYSLDVVLDPRVREEVRAIYSKDLFSVAEHLEVRGPGGKKMKAAEFRRKLLDATQAIRRITNDEIGYDLELVSDRLSAERSMGKMLLLCKLFEWGALQEQDGNKWRAFANLLALQLYAGEDQVIGSIERERLCVECLKRVYELSGSSEKKQFALDCLTEALFMYEDAIQSKVFEIVKEAKEPNTLASLMAFFARGGLEPEMEFRLANEIASFGRLIDGNRGREEAAVLFEGSKVEGHLLGEALRGFRAILSPHVGLPHPWYSAYGLGSGQPIANFRLGGIHHSSFVALGKIRSGAALGLQIEGINQLIVPHAEIDNEGRVVSSQREIGRAIGWVAESLHEALATNRLSRISEFAQVMMGTNAPVRLEDVEPRKLRRMGHLFQKFVEASKLVGVENCPLPKRASMGLVIGLLAGSCHMPKMAAANSALISRNYSGVFGGSEVDRSKRVTFLAKRAREEFVRGSRAISTGPRAIPRKR